MNHEQNRSDECGVKQSFTQWTERDPNLYVIGSDFPAERRGDMKTKLFVIPILVLAILIGIATPPAQAEFLTVSIILAVAFITAVVTTEVIKSETGTDHQVGIDHSKIILGPQ
jgi:hypothetical protein